MAWLQTTQTWLTYQRVCHGVSSVDPEAALPGAPELLLLLLLLLLLSCSGKGGYAMVVQGHYAGAGRWRLLAACETLPGRCLRSCEDAVQGAALHVVAPASKFSLQAFTCAVEGPANFRGACPGPKRWPTSSARPGDKGPERLVATDAVSSR